MKLTIDTTEKTLTREEGGARRVLDLYSREAFALLARQWVRVGWSRRYSYTFTWMGRPIIQLPEDMIRMQEVLYRVRPDVIVETGIAHGGSLIFYAGLCRAMGQGRVIGVDIEIRKRNREAVESHELSPLITLVEADSTAPETLRHVHSLVRPGESVLVILDSCHTREHVLAELEAYHDLVTPGSFIVATDGIMGDLHDVPGGAPGWVRDNPAAAAAEFARRHPEFALEVPEPPFNEGALAPEDLAAVTYWPGAWLRRRTGDETPGVE